MTLTSQRVPDLLLRFLHSDRYLPSAYTACLHPNTTFSHFCSRPEGSASSATQHSIQSNRPSRAQPLTIQPVPDLRIVQMLPGALFELVPHRLILPDHLIRQILQTGKTRKIQLPLRQMIALATVDGPGGGMQIPKLIMSHIRPGHKVIDGNVLRRQPILPVDFMNRRQLRKQIPIFFNLLQLPLLRPRLR